MLNSLIVLDLDEGISDDALLILPPPDMEPPSEDPSLSLSVAHSVLEESSKHDLSDDNLNLNTEMTPKDTAVDDVTMITVSPISPEVRSPHAGLLFSELTKKESKKLSGANVAKTSNYVGGDDKSRNSNSSADGSDKKTDDDIVVIDEIDDDMSHTQPVSQKASDLPGSDIGSEVASLQCGGTNPSQSDSDVECLEEQGNSREEVQKLNESQDSDVIVLDSTTETLDQATQAVGKSMATNKNTHLILHEPLVTLKHRNPKTTAAIEAAVDPLSFELPQNPVVEQNKDEARSITSSLQSISSTSVSAENPDSDSKNADSVNSTVEANQNEYFAAEVEDTEDTGLSGSMLYRCGYVTCTFSAENSSLLKDHLLVCDLARASSSLTCVHCKKQFKYVTSLLEHLRTHGTRRFRCSLCSFRAPVPQHMAKHLKQRHRVAATRVVPLNPLETDAETAMFVVFPKVNKI